MTSTNTTAPADAERVAPGAHLIALDVDGTIVDYDNGLADEVREAITAAVEAGHHLTIATGRAVNGALETANRLQLTQGFLVASNGSVIVRLDPQDAQGWHVHHVETFDPGPALQRMREVLPGAVWLVEDADLVRWTSAPFPDGELMGEEPPEVVSFEELGTKKATRIVMRDPVSTPEDFQAAVHTLGLHGVTYSVGWSNWLDIAPDGVSKASALEIVRRELGLAHEQTFAAGDGMNDLAGPTTPWPWGSPSMSSRPPPRG